MCGRDLCGVTMVYVVCVFLTFVCCVFFNVYVVDFCVWCVLCLFQCVSFSMCVFLTFACCVVLCCAGAVVGGDAP